MNLHGSLLFHLNLNYSSIEVADRPELVSRCYGPLLGLCERLPWLVMAVEASAHTLEGIEELDPDWIQRLRRLVREGRVEFVGSGDTQLIGPLVPASVNRWNQRLGVETYERLLDHRPRSALVNEMAWSQGIIDAYLDAGYETLLMEWNNPRRSHPEWQEEWRHSLVWSESPAGRRIALSWIDAVAFQKFQRAVVGDLAAEEYVDWVAGHAVPAVQGARHLFLYASDAEVFDFRPGRFGAEPSLPAAAPSEWERIEELLVALFQRGVIFTTPERLRADPAFRPEHSLRLVSAADPVPVKKQPKYNVTRWALTGWDDVGLNQRCFARASELDRRGGAPEEWRALCRCWASDLRTHLTETRWRELEPELESLGAGLRVAAEEARTLEVGSVQRRGDRLLVETDDVLLELNLRRGLAIHFLRFPSVSQGPLVGTLPHGYFDDIDWAADFYSGNTVIEMPAERRVTDLERVEPRVERHPDRVEVVARVETALGTLVKRVDVYADSVELSYGLSGLGERPLGSLRTGILTLCPESFGPELALTCASGGDPERLPVGDACDHGRSVSALISAGGALGASDGKLSLDDGRISLELCWPMSEAAALPLFTCQSIEGKRFLRIAFSLGEVDETHRRGAPLYDFRVSVRARRIAA